MAQVQLLQSSAVFENTQELLATLVVQLILEELQHPKVRASLTKLHHFSQTIVCHLGFGEIHLYKVETTSMKTKTSWLEVGQFYSPVHMSSGKNYM